MLDHPVLRRGFISELTMAYLPSRVSDVAANAKQPDREYERESCQGGSDLGPFDWCNDRDKANGRREVVDVNQLLGAVHVSVQPCLANTIRHCMHSIIPFLAIYKDWPRRTRANND